MQFETIPNNETWLVCGGRNYKDWMHVLNTLTNLTWVRGVPLRFVQGGALGADLIAKRWAEDQVLMAYTEKAYWNLHGKAAGPIRNQLMLDKYDPDLVIAFPGETGTANMVKLSINAGIEVIFPGSSKLLKEDD